MHAAQFASTHAQRQVGGLSVFGLATAKSDPMNRTVRLNLPGYVVDQAQISQRTQARIWLHNNLGIHKKNICGKPGQKSAKGTVAVEKNAGEFRMKSGRAHSLPTKPDFIRWQEPVRRHQLKNGFRFMTTDRVGSPTRWNRCPMSFVQAINSGPGRGTGGFETTLGTNALKAQLLKEIKPGMTVRKQIGVMDPFQARLLRRAHHRGDHGGK